MLTLRCAAVISSPRHAIAGRECVVTLTVVNPELLGDLGRLRDVLRRIDDPRRQALHHGLGVLLAVDLAQLREGLHHEDEPHVVARQVRDSLREDRDAAGGRELIQA